MEARYEHDDESDTHIKTVMMLPHVIASESHLSLTTSAENETSLKSHKDEIIDRQSVEWKYTSTVDFFFVLASDFSEKKRKYTQRKRIFSTNCVFFVFNFPSSLLSNGNFQEEKESEIIFLQQTAHNLSLIANFT